MRKIGGILLGIALGIVAVWGLYQYIRWALVSSFPWPVRISLVAVPLGLMILLASLARERHRGAKAEKERFKEVEK